MKKVILGFLLLLSSLSAFSQVDNFQATIFTARNPNTSLLVPDTVEGIGRFQAYDYTNRKLYNWQDTVWTETNTNLVVTAQSFRNYQPYLRGYKVYKAIITQAGGSAPTATVLENTIGSVTWSRISDGLYRLNLTGAFPQAKTLVFCQNDETNVFRAYRHSDDDILVESNATDSLIDHFSLLIEVYY